MMYRNNQKLLSILLMVLLWLSPLQLVAADTFNPPSQTELPCHTLDMSTDMDNHDNQFKPHCELCDNTVDCNNACANGHGFAPGMALLSESISLTHACYTSLRYQSTDGRQQKQHLHSLFRPPRV